MSDIVLNKICKSYGENVVLDNLSTTFKEGRVGAIMAASGGGKTTLLKVMTGLEKADSGEVFGIDNKKVAVVFQQDSLCENLTAFVNIKFVTGKDDNAIMTALKDIGLEGFEQTVSSKLSGGMKRRVAILRALLSDYDILFLDEPFKGLDEDTKNKVMDYTKKSTQGKTVILITHIKEEAEILAADMILEL